MLYNASNSQPLPAKVLQAQVIAFPLALRQFILLLVRGNHFALRSSTLPCVQQKIYITLALYTRPLKQLRIIQS